MQRQQQDTSKWLSLVISAIGLLLSVGASWEVGNRAGQQQAVENARAIATMEQQLRSLEGDRDKTLAALSEQAQAMGRIEGLLEAIRAARRP